MSVCLAARNNWKTSEGIFMKSYIGKYELLKFFLHIPISVEVMRE
jgi:hypothetical protein